MSTTRGPGRSSYLRHDLRAMMADGAAFSVMVGIGETYVPAFALALGLGEVASGLVATLPMLAGGLLQLVSPWAVGRLNSHRRWVVGCASLQAVSLLMLLTLALVPSVSPWWIFVPATLYWGAGLATAPAWNAWVEKLVPRLIRPVYFAQRTRVSHLCVLVGLVAGGLLLRGGTLHGDPRLMFAVLFLVAGASRFFSAAMLARQSEPVGEVYLDQNGASFRACLCQMWRSNAGSLLLYLFFVQTAVHLAAPFFTPFMLAHLKLTYVEYMLLLSCGFLGKIIALPWVGRAAKRAGAVRLLWIGGIAIVPLSGLWLVSNSMPFLIVLQLAGGAAWAAYELAMLLLFFETIPRRQRVTMLSLYNAGNAASTFLGAILGALIIHFAADGRTAYLAVFALSSVGRAAALIFIPSRTSKPKQWVLPTGLRTIAVRPMAGGIERPILPAVEAAGGDIRLGGGSPDHVESQNGPVTPQKECWTEEPRPLASGV